MHVDAGTHGPRSTVHGKDILHVEGAVCMRKDPCHGHFEKAEIDEGLFGAMLDKFRWLKLSNWTKTTTGCLSSGDDILPFVTMGIFYPIVSGFTLLNSQGAQWKFVARLSWLPKQPWFSTWRILGILSVFSISHEKATTKKGNNPT